MSVTHKVSIVAEPRYNVVRQEAKSVPEAAPAAPYGHDHEMMYAWSIGVTSVARALPDVVKREEYCPPEVYIG
jgi:hypothetical protein